MISLRPATVSDLSFVVELESQPHAWPFITALPLEEHEALFAAADAVHLMVESGLPESVGYFLLALEPDEATVELRRVVIAADARGIGQEAMRLAIAYCRDSLKRRHVWLDVYTDNARGIHVYEKLGFALDRKETRGDRCLLFYSMRL